MPSNSSNALGVPRYWKYECCTGIARADSFILLAWGSDSSSHGRKLDRTHWIHKFLWNCVPIFRFCTLWWERTSNLSTSQWNGLRHLVWMLHRSRHRNYAVSISFKSSAVHLQSFTTCSNSSREFGHQLCGTLYLHFKQRSIIRSHMFGLKTSFLRLFRLYIVSQFVYILPQLHSFYFSRSCEFSCLFTPFANKSCT